MPLKIGVGAESRATVAADAAALRRSCMRRLARRYAGEDGRGRIPEEALATLDEELALFEQEGLLSPLVHLERMWRPVAELAAPCAVQGAPASSVVLFGIGLLPFCPVDHGLLFDRLRVIVRDRSLEIAAVASPEVLALLASSSLPGDRHGIRLELHELEALRGHTHWEAIDGSLLPPSAAQVRAIVERLDSGGDDPFFGPRGSWGRAFIRTVRPGTFEELVLCQRLDADTLIEAGWPTRFAEGDGVAEPPQGDRDRSLLPRTRGLPMYQEDLMGVLQTAAGYGGVEAYRFLTVLFRDRPDETTPAKADFIERAMQHRFTRPHAEALLAVVEEGARLGICKANAISIGYLAAGVVLGPSRGTP